MRDHWFADYSFAYMPLLIGAALLLNSFFPLLKSPSPAPQNLKIVLMEIFR